MPLKNKNNKEIDVEFVCNTYNVSSLKVIQCNIRNIEERVLAAKLLEEHSEVIEKMNKFMVGREIKMSELKKEVKRLIKINKNLIKIADSAK